MRKVDQLKMMPGNILILPEEMGHGDMVAGIMPQRENTDQAIGRVIVSGGSDLAPGNVVVYKRVVAQDIRLLDDDGIENLYKIIHVDDVTGLFENNENEGRA